MDGASTLIQVVGAIAPSGAVLGVLAYMLRRRSEGIDTRLDKIEEKLDKSLGRIHERLDRVTKEQAELAGYVKGLQNGGGT